MKQTLCWKCRKATGNCPWSASFKPIKGWEAIPTLVYDGQAHGKARAYTSYLVKSCPLFENDKNVPKRMYLDDFKKYGISNPYYYTISQLEEKTGLNLMSEYHGRQRFIYKKSVDK